MEDQVRLVASVVIPVHNEEHMLSMTLPSVFRLKPREIVLIEDRCEDGTDEIARKIGGRYPDVKLVSIKLEHKSSWTNHLNYLYDHGIRNSTSRIVILTQADLLLDPSPIHRNLHLAEQGIVNFNEVHKGSIWTTLVIRFLSILPIRKFPGSVIALSRVNYLQDPFGPDDLYNFDSLIFRKFVLQKGEPCFVINGKNVNLRPYPKARLYELGMDNYRAGKAMWKVLLFSMTRLQPLVFAGYMHARNRTSRKVS